jgi:hypothetical protein
MNLSKYLFSLVVFAILIAGSISGASGQTDAAGSQQAEPTYEVFLHVIIGSNDAGGGTEMPASLSNLSRSLKGNFPFSNYRLANTFLGRISNNGTIEHKSVSNLLAQQTDAESQTSLEWSLANFRAMQNGFQARSFRFGARVPIRVGTTQNPGGATTPIVNYESIGLTMNTIGLPANSPTLIGTISLPKTTGTMFLIATIRTPAM